MKKGKVSLVGAGPGDAKLLTEKGRKCLEQADVIVYDLLACPSMLNLADTDCQLIFAGKQAGHHFKKQKETNQLLAELAKEGKNVVRLKGGDPFIFGRGGEEAQVLKENGVEFEIVPGVSSCYGVPAYAGIPVTHRSYASSFHVITGHKQLDRELDLDFHTLAQLDGTLVFLMSLMNLSHIAEELISCGKSPDTPAAVIGQGTTACQKTAVASLCEIAEEVKRQNIQTPAMTIIGDVVSLRSELKWFEKGALFGKKIIVTGTPEHSKKLSDGLSKYAADVAEISLIRMEKNTQVSLSKTAWANYTWIVFSSVNGVKIFFDSLVEDNVDIRSISHLKFAAIGKGTAEALAKRSIYTDLVPKKFDSKFLADELIPRLKEDDKVLLMRAENGTVTLQNRLEQAGKKYTCVSLYRTAVNESRKELLLQNLDSADYIVFSSSSAVRAYSQMTAVKKPLKAKIISIGPVTSKTAKELGISVYAQAEESSEKGIAECILKDAEKEV